MRTALLVIQTVTFIALGALMLTQGETKFGGAQLLLAGVNALVYS